MTVILSLPPDTERKLQALAARSGQDPATVVRRLVEDAWTAQRANGGGEAVAPSKPKSLAEIAAPVHEAFRTSGMTEKDLDDLLEECREDVWRDKRNPQPE